MLVRVVHAVLTLFDACAFDPLAQLRRGQFGLKLMFAWGQFNSAPEDVSGAGSAGRGRVDRGLIQLA